MRMPPGLAMSMDERSSLAVGAQRWRALFLILFVAATVSRLVIACTLSPFGDEAFYWQESLAPAWGYSDLPPMTAWLIRLSESVFGHGLLPMRLPFLVLGALLPWQVGSLTRLAGVAQHRWQAATLAFALPLAGSMGVLALPDVPLTFAILLAAQGLLKALDAATHTGHRWHGWLMMGIGLALAWATHYRAAMAMLAGLVFLLATPRGRGQWRQPGLWLALGVAAVGLLPLLLYNLASRGAGLAFQLVDRNPWRFHADALVQPLEQALACTPLLYVLLLWAAWRAWRRRGTAPYDVLGTLGGTFIVAYFVLGLFADDLRFRAHWPLPGYLMLCPLLPLLVEGAGQALQRTYRASIAVGVLGLALGLGYLGLAASANGAVVLARVKAFPSNFTGWREVAAAVKTAAPSRVLVADNFMLAAELRFALGPQATVYSLDSPLNAKHGRAVQLAAWSRDERGLARLVGRPALLVVDESSLREREMRDWLGSVCDRIALGRPVGRVDAFAARRRFALYNATVRPAPAAPGPPDACPVWQAARQALLDR
jgi:4-amino-4-deoxy-L-arabinose transferase-like glycosyltransferase